MACPRARSSSTSTAPTEPELSRRSSTSTSRSATGDRITGETTSGGEDGSRFVRRGSSYFFTPTSRRSRIEAEGSSDVIEPAYVNRYDYDSSSVPSPVSNTVPFEQSQQDILRREARPPPIITSTAPSVAPSTTSSKSGKRSLWPNFLGYITFKSIVHQK